MEDIPFYNERDYVMDGTTFVYAARQRVFGPKASSDTLINNLAIKLGAANESDLFTVSSELGNGALTLSRCLIKIEYQIFKWRWNKRKSICDYRINEGLLRFLLAIIKERIFS